MNQQTFCIQKMCSYLMKYLSRLKYTWFKRQSNASERQITQRGFQASGTDQLQQTNTNSSHKKTRTFWLQTQRLPTVCLRSEFRTVAANDSALEFFSFYSSTAPLCHFFTIPRRERVCSSRMNVNSSTRRDILGVS